jgi:MioC protein
MKINIVYATILGTSQMVAEDLEDALSDDHEVDVRDILHVGPGDLGEDALYVFAIFGLGDQGYADTFNMGSEKLAELLKGAGATQIGERGLFDASTGDMPEDIAIPWLEDILSDMPALAEAV